MNNKETLKQATAIMNEAFKEGFSSPRFFLGLEIINNLNARYDLLVSLECPESADFVLTQAVAFIADYGNGKDLARYCDYFK